MPDPSASQRGNPSAVMDHERAAYTRIRLAEIKAASREGSASWADPISDARWLLAEVDRLRAALYECASLAGEDTSDGAPTWPDLADWAVQAVRQMREDYDHA